MSGFVEICNNSTVVWSYICIDSKTGKHAGDQATHKGTIQSGDRVKHYHRDAGFSGIMYLRYGKYIPDLCNGKYDMKREYNTNLKQTFHILGHDDAGFKMNLEGTKDSGIPECDIPLGVSTARPERLERQTPGPMSMSTFVKKSYKDALQLNFWDLCQNMDSSEVINILYTQGCMSNSKKQQCQAEKVQAKRNDKLISWMMVQPEKTFNKFCVALDETAQRSFSKTLRDYIYP